MLNWYFPYSNYFEKISISTMCQLTTVNITESALLVDQTTATTVDFLTAIKIQKLVVNVKKT